MVRLSEEAAHNKRLKDRPSMLQPLVMDDIFHIPPDRNEGIL